MAKKLGVTKQRITLLEHDEVNGSATMMMMMKRVANALDCVFIYGLVPHVLHLMKQLGIGQKRLL